MHSFKNVVRMHQPPISLKYIIKGSYPVTTAPSRSWVVVTKLIVKYSIIDLIWDRRVNVRDLYR